MIKENPSSEMPRERCLKYGPSCLSLRECLALILTSGPKGIGCLGLANQILSRSFNSTSSESNLHSYSEEEILFRYFDYLEKEGKESFDRIKGLGDAKKAQLLAAFELGRKYYYYQSEKQKKLLSSSLKRKSLSLKELVLSKIPFERKIDNFEWLGFISIFPNHEIGQFSIVEKGARTHVNVDPIELFAKILNQRPSGIFLFHNHPSGSLIPSEEDFKLTQNVKNVCEQLGVNFFNHAIITPSSEKWIIN
jgi:DNA repair protein RadC